MVGVFLVFVMALVVVQGNEEANLMQAIIDGYPAMGRFARPVVDIHEALTVEVSLAPVSLASFKEKGENTGYGTLTVSGWLPLSWTDANVGWEPEDYGGIEKISIPAEVLKSTFWIPDISPYDGFPWSHRVQETDAVCFSTGMMILVPPTVFLFECMPDHGGNATACTTSFGSWTHDGYALDIAEHPQVDISNLAENPEWAVLSAEAVREVKTYDCCPEPYVSTRFTLTLQPTAGPFRHLPHSDLPVHEL